MFPGHAARAQERGDDDNLHACARADCAAGWTSHPGVLSCLHYTPGEPGQGTGTCTGGRQVLALRVVREGGCPARWGVAGCCAVWMIRVISYKSMRSTKRLRSVVHSIAHHAMSGLCFVHPHLGQVRMSLGAERVSVDLLRSTTEPSHLPMPREVELSTRALGETFCGLLKAEALDIGDVTAAIATFFFKGPVGELCGEFSPRR